MPALKLEAFMGLVPRASPRLLPPMNATEARNTKLLNGEVRGFRAMREEADFSAGSVSPVRRAVRVVDNDGVLPDTWLTFDSQNVDVVRSPIVNDAYDRYFWAGDGRPMMNTYARIENGDPAYLLGIPIPTNAPSVAPPAGTDETRAYVYTFVSSFGEEGQPSPPTVATGDAGQWDLSNIDTTVPDSGQRDIAFVNIYRTVTGGSSSNFYYVDQIAFGGSVYADNESATDVAANPLLESTLWAVPPSDLEGFVVMPNGYLVGWKGRRLVFSESYRPHAWPAEYELSTEYPIVGLVVWGSTLVIGTKSQPYFGQGTSPLSFTMQKLDAVEPCLSRRGMVATTAGAYYPSVNGLILANSNGAKVITQDILTKEEWALYNPQDIFAAQLGLQYLAFNSDNFGFIFNPTEPATKLVELDNFSDVEGIETDRYSGDVLVLSNDRAHNWDAADAERLTWRWQSKLFQFPEPLNFGAVRLNFTTGAEDVGDDVGLYYGAYNLALFAAVPSGPAPASGDALWSEVVFLADFEGADGATAYTEVSDNALVGTFVGSAALETDQFNFGASSLLLDGTTDMVTFPNDAALDLGSDDFTIEGFFRMDSLLSNPETVQIASHHGTSGNQPWAMLLQADGFSDQRLRVYVEGAVEVATINGTTLAVDTWYHWCIERTGTSYYVGVNGAREFSNTGVLSGALETSDEVLRVGDNPNITGDEFDGYQDDIRITKGSNRYDLANNSTYTPVSSMPVGPDVPAEFGRGLNTLAGHCLGGTPAQAIGLVPTWTEPETHQPLGGSLLYPENLLSFQTLAVRMIVKTGPDGTVRFDKVIYNEDIVRLPTGFKADLWQFDFYGNADLYSAQIGTTPRALKQV